MEHIGATNVGSNVLNQLSLKTQFADSFLMTMLANNTTLIPAKYIQAPNKGRKKRGRSNRQLPIEEDKPKKTNDKWELDLISDSDEDEKHTSTLNRQKVSHPSRRRW